MQAGFSQVTEAQRKALEDLRGRFGSTHFELIEMRGLALLVEVEDLSTATLIEVDADGSWREVDA